MKKVIIKADSKRPIGQVVAGTGAGTKFVSMTANKYSKEFILKSDNFPGQTIINAKKGDKVVFAYI